MRFHPWIVCLLALALGASPAFSAGWETELNRSRELLRAQRFDEAEAAAQAALREVRGAYGPSSRQAARALSQLGAVYTWQRRPDMAETAKTQALAIMERHFGPGHPILTYYLDSLALTLSSQRRYAEATALCERSLAIREAGNGPDDPEVARTLHLLAENYRRQQKYAEAESLGRRALEIRRKVLGPDHEDVVDSLFFLATLFEMQRKYAEAEPWYREALAYNERRFGPDSPRTASLAKRLADVLREAGKYPEAETLYRRAAAIWKKTSGPESPQTQAVEKRLESLRAHRDNAPVREKSDTGAGGRMTPAEWKARMERAERLWKDGETGRALGVAESAARDARTAAGPNHPWVAEALTLAGRLRREHRDLDGAEAAFRQALTILEHAHGADSVEVSVVLDHLAGVYRDRGQFPQALALGERSLEIWIAQFGAEHPTVRSRRERMEALRAEARLAAPLVPNDAPTVAPEAGPADSPSPTASPPRPNRPNRWRNWLESAERARAAAAEKWAELRENLDFGGLAETWEDHVGFLVRKFSWEEWAWIAFGGGFLVFLLMKDWN